MKKDWRTILPPHTGTIVVVMLILALVLVSISRNRVLFESLLTPSISDPVTQQANQARLSEIREPSSESFLNPLDIIPSDQQRESLSYGDVVAIYGAQRIQFDGDCRATPVRSIFPVDSTIIFDNRSEKLQGVAFDGVTYAVPPYHVRVIRLSRQGIFQVDCGQSKNVAQITVQ